MVPNLNEEIRVSNLVLISNNQIQVPNTEAIGNHKVLVSNPEQKLVIGDRVFNQRPNRIAKNQVPILELIINEQAEVPIQNLIVNYLVNINEALQFFNMENKNPQIANPPILAMIPEFQIIKLHIHPTIVRILSV